VGTASGPLRCGATREHGRSCPPAQRRRGLARIDPVSEVVQLILANHIDDLDVLREAIALAKEGR
jgi:hypothetical protein